MDNKFSISTFTCQILPALLVAFQTEVSYSFRSHYLFRFELLCRLLFPLIFFARLRLPQSKWNLLYHFSYSLFALELHTKTTHYNMKTVFFCFASVEQLFYLSFLLHHNFLHCELQSDEICFYSGRNFCSAVRQLITCCFHWTASLIIMQLSHHFSALISDHVIQSEKRFFFNSQTARDFRTLFTRSESKTFPAVARPQTDEGCQVFRWEDRRRTSKAERILARGKVEWKLVSLSKLLAVRASKCRRHSFSLIFHPHFDSKFSPHHKNPSRLSKNLFELHSIRWATVVPLVPFGFYRYSHV